MKELKKLLEQIESLTSEVLGIISAGPTIMPGKDMLGKAELLIRFRQAKDLYDSAKRDINKALDRIADQMARYMINEEMPDYDAEIDGMRYRFYPDAKGYYTVPHFCDPTFEDFFTWAKSQTALQKAAQEKGPQRALEAFCDAILEHGDALPPQVKSFIKTTVNVRRLSNEQSTSRKAEEPSPGDF